MPPVETAGRQRLDNLKNQILLNEWTLASAPLGRRLAGRLSNVLGSVRSISPRLAGRRLEARHAEALAAVEEACLGIFNGSSGILGVINLATKPSRLRPGQAATPTLDRRAARLTAKLNRGGGFTREEFQRLRSQLAAMEADGRHQEWDEILEERGGNLDG